MAEASEADVQRAIDAGPSTHDRQLWYQWVNPTRDASYPVGRASIVTTKQLATFSFSIPKDRPSVSMSLSFYHNFEKPYMSLDFRVRSSEENGYFRRNHRHPHMPSWKIFADNVLDIEEKAKESDGNDVTVKKKDITLTKLTLGQAPAPAPTIIEQMNSANDRIVAPGILSGDDNIQKLIEANAMWCMQTETTKKHFIWKASEHMPQLPQLPQLRPWPERQYGGNQRPSKKTRR